MNKLWILALMSTSCMTTYSRSREQGTKTITVPCEKLGQSLAISTHNGTISLNGESQKPCEIKVAITAYADSKVLGQKLLDSAKAYITTSSKASQLEFDHAEPEFNESLKFDVTASLPPQTALELDTHNGRIHVSGIAASVSCQTHNATIELNKVQGSTRCSSHNGSIRLKDIAGLLELSTHNGDITIDHSKASKAAPPTISIATHNGDVSLVIPKTTSAKLDLSTHNGNISYKGTLSNIETSDNKLSGKIGDGRGHIAIATHNGHINLTH